MKLSDGIEWGIHVTTLLAVLPPDGALPAARLAEFHGVPAAYLAKHLQALSRARILESIHGPRGGYRLAKPAAEISVLDVVEAIDGSEPAFRCTEIRRRGPAAVAAREYRLPCGVHRAFTRADDAWRRELEAVTIASLVIGVVHEAPRAAVEKATRWLGEAVRTS